MRCLSPALAVGLAAFSLALLAGCSPTTQYRRSAYVPAVRPIPFDGRTAPAGTLRIEGTETDTGVSTNPLPQPGDSALLVPRWSLEGSVMLAVNSHLELGVRAAYADYAWRQESAAGTMPIPTAPPSTGYGPEVRLSFPLQHDGRFALGFAANLMLYHVPYSEWTLTGAGSSPAAPACTPSATCVAGYALYDTRADDPLVYSVGVYPSYAFGEKGEYGHLFGLLGASNGFSNDGFSDKPANGSTLSSVGPIWTLGIGYGFSRDWGRVNVLAYRPLTDESSPVDYGFGLQLTLGVNLDLWEHKSTDDGG
jgi:hypothetical protein